MLPLDLDESLMRGLLATTESAAIAASRHVGLGDKNAVDAAAVRAMRAAFDRIPVRATVVVGEGEKDRAPMLFSGERLGSGSGPALDVAVDPVDGTRLAANGLPGSVAVLSIARSGAFYDPGPVFYFEKLVTVGAGRALGLDRRLEDNLRELSRAVGRPVGDLRVAVQARPRNRRYVDEAAAAGARVIAFDDGDVDAAVRAARAEGDLDLLIGIGGAPEGVLTAAAVASLGGHMQARPAPQHAAEIARAAAAGISTTGILRLDDLVGGDGYLFLTAVTAGDSLAGVVRDGDAAVTDSWMITPGRGLRRVTRRHADATGHPVD